MATRWSAVALGAIVAGLTVSACAGGSTDGRRPIGSHSGPRATLAPTRPDTKPITLGPTTTIALGSSVGPVESDGRVVVFPEAQPAHRNWDQVMSVDIAGHHRREAAHTTFSRGLVNWAVPAGSWIVYTDQSARQSDWAPKVRWRVIAIEPGTAHRITLSSNGENPDPFVPVLQSKDGEVFWTQAENDRSARELLWRPGWTRPHDVIRHAEMSPGSASIDAGHLVYLGPAATGASGHTTGGDCWRVPLAGGTPQAMTHTALAMGCFAARGALLWTQHIDPNTKDKPRDGILDDPYELWARQPGGAVLRLEHGYVPSTYPAIGGGYVIWRTYPGRLVLQSTDDPQRRTMLPGKPATDLQITDGVIFYVTTHHGRATAHVVPLAPVSRSTAP